MFGSTFGNLFKVTTWGESHGKGIGVVIDGCPAGLPLCEEDIQTYLDRRKPGQSRFTTMRKEADRVKILSGVFEGKTTGTPISLMVKIPTSVLMITVKSPIIIARDMQIVITISNTDSAITVGADVLPDVKPSVVLLPVQLRRKC